MKATLTAAMILVSGFSVFADEFTLLTPINTSLTPPANLYQLASLFPWASAGNLTFGNGVLPAAGSPSSPADFGADTEITLVAWSPNVNWNALMNLGDGTMWNPSSPMGSLNLGVPQFGFSGPDLGQLLGSIKSDPPIGGLQPPTLNDISLSPEVQSVPEPSAFALAGAGLAILCASRSRARAALANSRSGL